MSDIQQQIEQLRNALQPFAELPLPERNGFTLYTREELLAARAAYYPPTADGWWDSTRETSQGYIEQFKMHPDGTFEFRHRNRNDDNDPWHAGRL